MGYDNLKLEVLPSLVVVKNLRKFVQVIDDFYSGDVA